MNERFEYAYLKRKDLNGELHWYIVKSDNTSDFIITDDGFTTPLMALEVANSKYGWRYKGELNKEILVERKVN